jgi:hypothetical protein
VPPDALEMARSILSFGIDSARAFWMARRSRELASGSGPPSLAATMISRASLAKSLDFIASWRPFRCMMFLNCECPAMFSLHGTAADRAGDPAFVPEY